MRTNHHVTHARSSWKWAVVCLVAGFALGCAPRGQSSGRVEVTDTKSPERRVPQILPVALIEFSDQVPPRLVADLEEIPQIHDTPGRVTVLMGDINNKTQIVSSDEFEMVRSRIRNNLLQSRYAKSRIRFLEDRERLDYLRYREKGLESGGQPTLDPETTYILNGDFYRINRREVNLYYMEFQLVHFATNEIVFSEKYDVKQIEP